MINIAIMGYGVVGSGVAEVFRMNEAVIQKRAGQSIRIKKILDVRAFPDDPCSDCITRKPEEIFDDPEIAIVVETIGGTGVAFQLTRRALEAGKHVVTSNKELVASKGPELLKLAREKGINYLFEASVGGGIPIVMPLLKCLSANVIERIAGILNGTTNYILTRMDQAGIRFDQALTEAQENGYAEQNPTADLDGLDACRKLAILTSITLGEFVDNQLIHTEGITSLTPTDLVYARHLDMKLKLISRFILQPGKQADMIVAPMLIERNHPIAVADDVNNAILVTGNALGDAMFYGRGAGKKPTASAVVADIMECALHLGRTPHRIEWAVPDRQILKPHEDCTVRALLRLSDGVSEEKIKAVFFDHGVVSVDAHVSGEQAWIVGSELNMTERKLAEILKTLEPHVLSRIRLY